MTTQINVHVTPFYKTYNPSWILIVFSFFKLRIFPKYTFCLFVRNELKFHYVLFVVTGTSHEHFSVTNANNVNTNR